jgi:hypothetical protein
MSQQELEFKIGEDEKPATVELTESEDGLEAKVADAEPTETRVEQIEQPSEEKPKATLDKELGQYTDTVKKRIDKLTARLRETERREQAALDYARQVQVQAQELQKRFQHTDSERIGEAKSRIETQAVALKQIIKKAREEGDIDTETEAQERLTEILFEQRRVKDEEAVRERQLALAKQQQELVARQQQQQQAYAQQAPRPDPRAEEWAEKNDWYGRDVAMTSAAQGIHAQLISIERFDPTSDEYYDELDRRIRDAFPHRFQEEQAVQQTTSRASRPVQTVAPASRSSGVNNIARRTVKLTPSQVAIAKKLGVPLEEYAKYVKE